MSPKKTTKTVIIAAVSVGVIGAGIATYCRLLKHRKMKIATQNIFTTDATNAGAGAGASVKDKDTVTAADIKLFEQFGQVKLGSLIDSGNHGQVYNVNGYSNVVCKVQPIGADLNNEKEETRICNYAADHGLAPRVYATIRYYKSTYIFMEKILGKTIERWWEEMSDYSNLKLAVDDAKARLSNLSINHGALHNKNIMAYQQNGKWIVKFIDFGKSSIIQTISS